MKSKRTEDGLYIPTAAFKMPKVFKRLGAGIINKDTRDAWRAASIQAHLASLEVIDKKKKDKDTD